MEGVAELAANEQQAALRQQTCPVTKQLLGSMGKPIRVSVAGRSVFVCCEGCISRLRKEPQRYLKSSAPGARSFGQNRNDLSTSPRRPERPQRTLRIPRGMEGIALLPASEQQSALQQRTCPVMNQPLGSMGKPIRVRVAGRSVFVCCEGCISRLKSNPAKYLTSSAPGSRSFGQNKNDLSVFPRRREHPQRTQRIPRDMEGIALLPVSEQQSALQQRTCPVMNQPLGSMGKPIRVRVAGRSVFVCCEGCINRLKSNPAKYLTSYRHRGTNVAQKSTR